MASNVMLDARSTKLITKATKVSNAIGVACDPFDRVRTEWREYQEEMLSLIQELTTEIISLKAELKTKDELIKELTPDKDESDLGVPSSKEEEKVDE